MQVKFVKTKQILQFLSRKYGVAKELPPTAELNDYQLKDFTANRYKCLSATENVDHIQCARPSEIAFPNMVSLQNNAITVPPCFEEALKPPSV